MSDTNNDPFAPDDANPAVGLARSVTWDALQPQPEDPMLLESVSRRGAVFDVLLLIVTIAFAVGVEFFFGGAAALLLGVQVTEPGAAPPPEFLRVVLVPAMAIRTLILTAAIVWITRFRSLQPASLGVSWRSWGLNLLIGVGLIVYLYGLMLVGLVVLQALWPSFVSQLQENSELLANVVPKLHPAMLLLLMILVAWWEELVFRGFLMPRIRRIFGSWTIAVVVSCMLFVLPHMMEQTGAALLPIALLAVAFSLVTIWRRSLVPAIVAHLLFNVSQFFMLYYGPQAMRDAV